MLGGIVDAAVKWMKAGLPLKRLKIVLYASVVKGKVISIKMRDPDGILKTFENLKKRYNKLELIPMVSLDLVCLFNKSLNQSINYFQIG